MLTFIATLTSGCSARPQGGADRLDGRSCGSAEAQHYPPTKSVPDTLDSTSACWGKKALLPLAWSGESAQTRARN